MKLVVGSLLALSVAVALPLAIARADHPHHPPPQAAFDACASSKAGDVCTVTLHEHAINGVCVAAPDTSALVCRPDHPPGPPPQAIEACNGRSAGDACSIAHDGHAIAGTCASRPDGNGPLACRPSDAPPHRP